MTRRSPSSYMTESHRSLECWPKSDQQSPVIVNNHNNNNHSSSSLPLPKQRNPSSQSSLTRDNANKMELSSSSTSFRRFVISDHGNSKQHRNVFNSVNRCPRKRKNKTSSLCSTKNQSHNFPCGQRSNQRSTIGPVEGSSLDNWLLSSLASLWEGGQSGDHDDREVGQRTTTTSTSTLTKKDKMNSQPCSPWRRATDNFIMSLIARPAYKISIQNSLVILFGILVLISTCVPHKSHALASNSVDNNNNNHLVEVHEYNDAILTPYIQANGQFGGTLLGTSQHENAKDIVRVADRKLDDEDDNNNYDFTTTTNLESPLVSDNQATGNLSNKDTNLQVGPHGSLEADASSYIVTASSGGDFQPQQQQPQHQSFLVGQSGSINLPPGHQLQINLNPSGQTTSTTAQTSSTTDYRSLLMPAMVAGSMVGARQNAPLATTATTMDASSNNLGSQQPPLEYTSQLNNIGESQLSSPEVLTGGGHTAPVAKNFDNPQASTKLPLANGEASMFDGGGDSMMAAGSHKSKKMKKKKEKKHKEWKKGKKHKKKKYESKKKKGGAMKKKKGKKEKKKWGMEKKGHKKKGNFKKKKWGHKKKKKAGKKGGKKGHKFYKDKGHKKKGFKKIYHKEEWGKKKKWHDVKREKKWNTKHKKWKKKWSQEKGKKYKGKHMKKYHKKNKHGKKYKKEKKSKYKKHKGEKYKKGHKKKKEEYAKKKEGGKKKMKKEMKKKKKG